MNVKTLTMTRVKDGWTLHVGEAPIVYERWGKAQDEWSFTFDRKLAGLPISWMLLARGYRPPTEIEPHVFETREAAETVAYRLQVGSRGVGALEIAEPCLHEKTELADGGLLERCTTCGNIKLASW